MDDLVKLYIDYRIKKNLPELSREEIFILVDFNTWQEKHANHAVDAAVAEVSEIVRRWMLHEECFGDEKLYKEFGAPEHPESSICMEEWLDRVLRNPSRAWLAAHPKPDDVRTEAEPKLPKAITWNEAMQERERDFNKRYYGNKDGEPRFPHEEV